MPHRQFHPAVADWFTATFGSPSGVQTEAWPAIAAGTDTLIAAPTGSGKTLAAFLAVLDDLVRRSAAGPLPDAVQAVYVTPLRALSNDIHRNLEAPLAGIEEHLQAGGDSTTGIRVAVRTGDTPRSERDRMRHQPPHVLVTTPESLHILLTSESGRAMLAPARTVIVDEIHALAATKRGAHLALSLERLAALGEDRPTRVGLSATQNPIEEVARFLVGSHGLDASGQPACRIVDAGHFREADLALEVPESPLEPIMSREVWDEVHDRIADLARDHRTTLVFTNNRRRVERVARQLGERLESDAVAAHHGSLSRDHRLAAEQALKHGEVRVLVATASLELGIDIGDVDLVVQLGATHTIAHFLQRVGRSGHRLDAVPKGRLFPLSRDDLVASIALVRAARDGELDRLSVPEAPLDVLAQHLVAEVAAAGEATMAHLKAVVRKAYPFRSLSDADFTATARMLAEGFATGKGRTGALIHHDPVHDHLRPRRGARITALTCAGTIPDEGDFDVVLEPEERVIGSVNEDFALETVAGTVFQLGNRAYRFLRIQDGRVRVADAGDQPPGFPFWFGTAPGRSEELSRYVADLRRGVEERMGKEAVDWLAATEGVPRAAAEQAVHYLAAARNALGALPTLDTIVLERFFDESGGMQLLVHAPFGSRVNKAWGLALRKRFCRKFNFELQAAATEDAIILSLASAHSFPLAEVAGYLSPESVRDILIQALLDAPLFTTRWRWNATTALAIRRFRGGKRTPPQLQRMEAEDLISAVFPDQIACFENIDGEREVPDHPLVNQTLHDCLHDALDLTGLEGVLAGLRDGRVAVTAADLTEPSPLAHEILGASPYAFIDDAPAEERRTRMVQVRRWLDPADAADLGRLDPEAIARVREEAWPDARDRDELQDALAVLGAVTATEGREAGWSGLMAGLQAEGRAAVVRLPGGGEAWVAAERWGQVAALHPDADPDPTPNLTSETWERETALRELIRGRLEGLGPVTTAAMAEALGVSSGEAEAALTALEAEGAVFRGHYSPEAAQARTQEWCERRLLARIHRHTLDRLRREIEPVSPADTGRFLVRWQGLAPDPAEAPEGPEALLGVIEQLEGFEAPAAAWEGEILPARLPGYDPQWLDQLCLSGRVVWLRLSPPRTANAGAVRSTPVTLVQRQHLPDWLALAATREGATGQELSGKAARLEACLRERGAQFLDELVSCAGILRTEAETALGELVTKGRVHSDSFAGLRALMRPPEPRRRPGRRGRPGLRGAPPGGVAEAGRWTAVPSAPTAAETDPGALETAAWTLLARYGVVFRALLAREADWLPPWRELVRSFRRLEDRGEVRGGRFVAGFSGEQFALPDAVSALRRIRREGGETEGPATVPAADPLNLAGILVPGEKVPARAGHSAPYPFDSS